MSKSKTRGRSRHLLEIKEIPTTKLSDIKKLSSQENMTPLNKFLNTLTNQKNLFNWVEKKVNDIDNINDKLKSISNNYRYRTARNETYNQYLWYLRKICLLEAINAFETFYKDSVISLSKILLDNINLDKIKGSIEKSLIIKLNPNDVINVVFESELYHSTSKINEITQLLFSNCEDSSFYLKIEKPTKNPKNLKYKEEAENIDIIFQLRHTLSHNNGFVTISDAKKIRRLSGNVKERETLDLSKKVNIKIAKKMQRN